MNTLGRILFLTILVAAETAIVQAQGTLTARANNFQPSVSSVENDTDRARDGLLGPVRRIRSEVVKVTSADGKLIENGKRVLLEAAEYDFKGVKTVNQYFPVAGSSPTGREIYKYDDKGNISEMTLTGADGALISKEVYKYEYDSLGNWTKMTTSVAVVENGAISFEPVEVTYRTISYYLNATVTNMVQPANNAALPAKNTSSTPTDNRNANLKSAPQTTVPSLQIPRRATIALSAPAQPIGDFRNTSFVTNQTVAVDNAPAPPAPRSHPAVSGGVLNGNAISLPAPVYPEAARRMGFVGVVEVEVTIDENGKVVSAKAISGPVMLRDSAVQAALRAKFTPSKLSGQPVKITGKIVYNFKRPS
jgi:TonB family protein